MPVLLVLVFLVVPIAEIWVIIQVGSVIGALPTLLLLIAESLLGAWLIRREGRRAWRALREGVSGGRLPDRELADGGLILVGGTLLLTPGFLTDIVGFFFVLPFTRPIARRALTRWLTRRAKVRLLGPLAPPATRFPGGSRRGAPERGADRVVPGEVVDGLRPPADRPDEGRPGL